MFIADYVLMGYGTGAIMAVPGQDQRDWDFAEAFGLPIVRTVQPPEDFDGQAYVGAGPAINSDFLDGLEVAPAKERIIAWLEEHGRRRGHRHLQAARLAVQPPALLGRAVPDRLRRGRPAAGGAGVRAAGPAAGDRRLRAGHLRRRELDARAAARSRPGLGRGRAGPGRRPEGLPARAEHDAAVGRLVLVRAALPRPDQRGRLRRPAGRAVLDGPAVARRPRRRRPVRRRRRARRPAPALRPAVAQGPVRPRPPQLVRAVPPAVQPGLHPGRARSPTSGASTSRRPRSSSATAASSTATPRSPASSGRWARA